MPLALPATMGLKRQILGGFIFLLPGLSACTLARMDVHGLQAKNVIQGGATVPGGAPTPAPAPGNKATDSFIAGPTQRRVDILFVDDNSASMDPRQSSLGSKFAAFASAVQGLDWQIGITTTDCSAGPWGICGSLLPMAGTASNILTSSVPNYTRVFANTIVRPETIGCIARGACPSGISEPLKATMTAVDKRLTNNAGFFRDGAALVVIILTNADEQDSGPATATQPSTVYRHLQSVWPTGKDMTAYAVDIVPGDNACLALDRSTASGDSYFGVAPSGLASLMNGQSESICSADYSTFLQQIGNSLQLQPNVITLSHVPMPGTLSITLIPNSPSITWTLNGVTVVFSSPLPQGTNINAEYQY